MDISIASQTWRRRGAPRGQRKGARKRERRPHGYLAPRAAALRRQWKRTRHRHARRVLTAQIRASLDRANAQRRTPIAHQPRRCIVTCDAWSSPEKER
jgi:hypothetical protein